MHFKDLKASSHERKRRRASITIWICAPRCQRFIISNSWSTFQNFFTPLFIIDFWWSLHSTYLFLKHTRRPRVDIHLKKSARPQRLREGIKSRAIFPSFFAIYTSAHKIANTPYIHTYETTINKYNIANEASFAMCAFKAKMKNKQKNYFANTTPSVSLYI